MPKTLAALTFSTAIGLVCCQSAGAAPASGMAARESTRATSPLRLAQYTERRTRHGIVKCYRDLVIGPYHCHYYPGSL